MNIPLLTAIFDRIKNVFGVSCLGLVYYLCLFQFPFSYNFMPEINNQYSVFTSAVICFSVFVFFLFFSSKRLSFHLLDVLLFALLIYSLINIVNGHTLLDLNNEYFVWCIIMLMIYFLIRFSEPFIIEHFIPILIAIFFVIELFLGLKQLFDNVDAKRGLSLAVKGSLQNSGIYSCYLIISLPLFTYLLKKVPVKKYFKITLLTIILISTIVILFVTKSRTAIITLAAFLILFSLYHSRGRLEKAFAFIKKHKAPFFLFILTPLVSCSYLLFQMKPASFIGRILVWKITLLHISDYIFSGIGFGNFSLYYPYWQIEYFSNHLNSPTSYVLNAAETHVAFNEFLQIFAEKGIFGLIAFVVLIIYLLKLKTTGQSSFIFVLKATIILALLSSLSTYALHCNSILFLFIFCIAALLSFSGLKRYSFVAKTALSISFLIFLQLLIGLTIIKSIQQSGFISKWISVREDVFLQPSKIKLDYLQLYPHLKTNGKFLLDMGEHLADIDDLKEAINVLEESKRFYISERTFAAISNVYYQSGNIQRAIGALEDQSNLIPSEFYSKYNLIELYNQSGDSLSAKKIAGIILSMPVKKNSPDVDKIKKKAKEVLSKKK